MTYFHNSNEGLELLKENLRILSRENYYLILASHSPLDVELQKIHSEYMNSLKELLTEFGLEKSLRNFKINRMSDITEEEI